ncbi:MAG: lipocalin-like domain-containing protein [Paludibacteraceae bacterium]
MEQIKTVFITIIASTFIFTTPLYGQISQSSDISSETLIGTIWHKLVGNTSYTQQDLVGKWNFDGTACKFKTENLLKKAGGAIVATQVESAFDEYCEKMGIKEGKCYFEFKDDSTYSAKLGVIKLSGKYTMNSETKLTTLSYALGIAKTNAFAVKSGNNLKLYFDADGFLKMMKTASLFTNNNKVEILAKMAELYDGMLLGFDLDLDKKK